MTEEQSKKIVQDAKLIASLIAETHTDLRPDLYKAVSLELRHKTQNHQARLFYAIAERA
jgi:hypothetical protein